MMLLENDFLYFISKIEYGIYFPETFQIEIIFDIVFSETNNSNK